MYEIEKVDSFLQSHALINLADARYFTTVNDNWDYSSWPVRESGRRISLGLAPGINYYYSYSHSSSDTSEISYLYKNSRRESGVSAIAMFDAAKPVDLHWQRNISAHLSLGFYKKFTRDLVFEEVRDMNSLDAKATLAYEVGYYPNSRTDLSGQVNLDFRHSYGKYFYLLGDPEKTRYTNITPRFILNLHYYISPQARLNVYYTLLYQYTNNDVKGWFDEDFMYYKMNTFQQGLDIGFQYSFF